MAALELDDGTLWYDVTGSGRSLVLIHGGWMNGDAWAPQVDRFADDFRVVTMDLRGHGRTGPTGTRRYTVDLFVDDLERLLSHLEVDEPIVCGLSLGNVVTQEFLNRYPDRLRAAILGGPARSMPPVDIPLWAKLLTCPEPAIRASLSIAGTRGTFRSMLASIRSATGRPWLSIDREIRARAIDAAGEITPTEYLKIFNALYRYDPPTLTHVSTPTLVVYGEDESFFVKHQGRQVVADVADGAARSIPDAAHLVNMDNPTAFNAAVNEFLADVEAAA